MDLVYNGTMRVFTIAFIFLVSLLEAQNLAPEAAIKVCFTDTTIRLGSQHLYVQVANTPEALQRGLMFRRAVAPYDGMLFVFLSPQKVVFWMKNTLIPLDVGYFDSQGVLREIHPLRPFDETSVTSQSDDIRYALELPQGDFAKKGIKIGDLLEISEI